MLNPLMKSRKFLIFVPLVLVILFVFIFLLQSATPNAAQPINAGNVDRLELGYGIAGVCNSFSPDGKLIATGNTVYDAMTGKEVFSPFGGTGMSFSPDGKLLSVGGDAVYEVSTWQSKFKIGGESSGRFTEDSKYLYIWPHGIYDTSTGNKVQDIFATTTTVIFIPGGQDYVTENGIIKAIATGEERRRLGHRVAAVSADGKWFVSTAMSRDGRFMADDAGVYELATGTLKFKFGNDAFINRAIFSSDGKFVVIDSSGVQSTFAIYNLETGEKVTSQEGINFVVSQDGRYVAVHGKGVYQMSTGKHLFEIKGDPYSVGISFNTDSSVIAVGSDGVHDLPSGQKFIPFPRSTYPRFNADGTLLAVTMNGSSNTAPACLIYGLKDTGWPYRAGIVRAKGRARLVRQPGSQPVSSADVANLLVVAKNSAGSWYKVPILGIGITTVNGETKTGKINDYLWVNAQDIEILTMPDNLPQE